MRLCTVHLGLNIYDTTLNQFPLKTHIHGNTILIKCQNPDYGENKGQLIFLLQLKTKIRSVLTKGYRWV